MVKFQTALALGLIVVFFYLGGVGYTKAAVQQVKETKDKIFFNLPQYTLKANDTISKIKGKLNNTSSLPPPSLPEPEPPKGIVY